jgi:hypothetical protein
MTKKMLAVVVFLLSVSAFAQFGGQARRGGGGFGFNNGPTGGQCLVPGTRDGGNGEEDLPTPRKFEKQGFVYGRVRYHIHPVRMREVPWHHDYPDGDSMFPATLGRLTLTDTDFNSFQIVDIDSKELFKYPFVYMSEPGYLDLLPADVKNLREYLDRGGFLLMDDFRGNPELDMSQYDNMRFQMKKVFPDREIQPVPPNHAIFHSFYDINPKNMLPPYRIYPSGEPEFLGIFDAKGNIQVMIDFNNDISEYWQALDTGACSIHEAGLAVELGVNYAVYAMTH